MGAWLLSVVFTCSVPITSFWNSVSIFPPHSQARKLTGETETSGLNLHMLSRGHRGWFREGHRTQIIPTRLNLRILFISFKNEKLHFNLFGLFYRYIWKLRPTKTYLVIIRGCLPETEANRKKNKRAKRYNMSQWHDLNIWIQWCL